MIPATAMKGFGRRILLARSNGNLIELFAYADDSWGIEKNGQPMGVREPSEAEECMGEFGRMMGLADLKNLLILHTSKLEGQFEFDLLPASLN